MRPGSDEEARRTSLPDIPVVVGRRHAVQLLDVSAHPSGMLFAPVTSKGLGMLGLSFSDRPTRQRSRWRCPWLGFTQFRCGAARSKWFMRTFNSLIISSCLSCFEQFTITPRRRIEFLTRHIVLADLSR
jgi:hypothetical protein